MSLRERVRSLSCAGNRALAVVLVVATLGAVPASAYVVVTSDNRVYNVATRPELSGDLVMFTLDGAPVSLRIYDVNLRATNEINSLMDSGASNREIQSRIAGLPQAVPVDQRLIAASPLHRKMKENEARERGYEATRRAAYPPPSSAQGYPPSSAGYPPPSSAPPRASSPFAQEARQAMDEAERRSRQPGTPPSSYTPSSSYPPPSNMGSSGRVGDLDAEIAAEQAYLRQLTAGEVVVDDLDRAIADSMDKIAGLQKRRDKLTKRATKDEMAMAPAQQPMSDFRGIYPPGSREAGWEREIAESQARIEQLRAQQATIPAGSSQEREMVDEQIGELEHRIERLKDKLSKVSR